MTEASSKGGLSNTAFTFNEIFFFIYFNRFARNPQELQNCENLPTKLPFAIWLLETHPNQSPIGYVAAQETDLYISATSYVTVQGKINNMDWQPNSPSPITSLIEGWRKSFPMFACPTLDSVLPPGPLMRVIKENWIWNFQIESNSVLSRASLDRPRCLMDNGSYPSTSYIAWQGT